MTPSLKQTSYSLAFRERISTAVSCVAGFTLALVLLVLGTEMLAWAILPIGARDGETHFGHSFYHNQPWAAAYWQEFKASNTKEYRPYTVWRRAPFKGTYVNIDADGLRRTANPTCTPEAPQIWMFGSSTLWGTGATDDQTIPSFLSQEYSRSIGPVCVTNFGETGWNNTQEVIQLAIALKHAVSRPNLVIFYDGFADVFVPYQSGTADVHLEFESIRALIEAGKQGQSGFAYLKGTNTYRLITAVMDDIAQIKEKNSPSKVVSPHRDLDRLALMAAQNYLANWKLVESLSVAYGFRRAAFWGPTIFTGNKPLAPAEHQLRESNSLASPGLAKLCQKTYGLVFSHPRPNIVNLAAIFDRTGDDLYLDPAHLIPPANHLIASDMVARLRASGIVPVSTR